jgi:pilus assembly protein Flp/PilA
MRYRQDAGPGEAILSSQARQQSKDTNASVLPDLALPIWNCAHSGSSCWAIVAEKEEGEMLYLPREEAQGTVEYALILVMVAMVVIAILLLLGPQVGNTFSRVTSGVVRMAG